MKKALNAGLLISILCTTYFTAHAQLNQQLARLSLELEFLKKLLPKEPFEEFVDIKIEKSTFGADTKLTRYQLVAANSAINSIAVLLLDPKKKNPQEAQKIMDDLQDELETATGRGDRDKLDKLLSSLIKLMAHYPLTISKSVQALKTINQYPPSVVFNTLIRVLAPVVRDFSREITKELTRHALSIADPKKRKEHRRFIRDALSEALRYINLVLDQYVAHKDNTYISKFDKDQFFGQIIFNWQAIKKGYTSIKTELTSDDTTEILDEPHEYPTIADPAQTTKRSLEDYYQKTRERIEGLGKAEDVIKPLRILLIKIVTKLREPSKPHDAAVSNFVLKQIPSKMEETGAFLEYHYSEFDTQEKMNKVVDILTKGSQDGIKGSAEAKIIHQLADEIKKYRAFRAENDAFEDLVDKMKKDPSKFATPETIEEIIKTLDEVGKKSKNLADPSLRRNEKEDEELKKQFKETKKSINIGAQLAPELAANLQKICVWGKIDLIEATVQKEIRDKEVYRNLDVPQQLLVLQAVLGHLIKQLYDCAKGNLSIVKCNTCTYGAAWVISKEITKSNPHAPDWVKALHALDYIGIFPKDAFMAAFEDVIK